MGVCPGGSTPKTPQPFLPVRGSRPETSEQHHSPPSGGRSPARLHGEIGNAC
ncbi:uncharacterized protein THITE_2122561 [Thermothielavioides terrestris NRRL 8126]|uniref:Uncharacterized protein n=1 Tax=Thermothielavioides terrestris (strain ATCC 38088 / NRRL 8126) TaxID=578455 RepID=G2RDK6_THETT|nr:uncharacterized protein THITE_2122561 [Thermothielavioides terrestris NRRL 8126]AEO70791.1 hypothetical protein THITE_2122561 [Thermothielavioides terrestris NRRL 8126]